jgi:iron complex outermembrane recepter protein
VRPHLLFLFLFAAAAAPVRAQTGDLTSLSLEEFLKVEVTSVSKSREKLVRSPAAVYVITQEDIRRSGASTLPEVLRLAPGVHVARISGSAWAVGIRGVNNIYSNKLLVLIDGRTVYNPLFSGTLWHEHLVLLEDIDRIEVIRGPGATMWGANAVSGVISITTLGARAAPGGQLRISGGTLNPVRSGFVYGAESGDRLAWKVAGQYERLNQPVPVPGDESAGAVSVGRGSVRLEWKPGERDTLLVDAQAGHNLGSVSSVDSSTPGSSRVSIDSQATVSFAMGRWTHQSRSGNETAGRAYVTNTRMEAGDFTGQITTVDFDLQQSVRLGPRHRIVAGGGARTDRIATGGAGTLGFQPSGRTYNTLNAFVEEQWDVAPDKLTLSGGAKLERYTVAGTSLQPTGRVMWTPTPRQGYWAAVSRAVRTPAHTDYALRATVQTPELPFLILLQGNDQFRPEVLDAYETGARFQFTRRLAIDATGFEHRYGRLPGYVYPRLDAPPRVLSGGPGWPPVIPMSTANLQDGVNRGIESAVQYDVLPGLQLSACYAALSVRTWFRPGFTPANTYVFPDNTPEHQGHVRAAWNISRRWSADGVVYVQGATRGALPGYTRLDARLSRQLGESLEIGVSGQHLLRPHQTESAGDFMYRPVSVPRSVEVSLRWRF